MLNGGTESVGQGRKTVEVEGVIVMDFLMLKVHSVVSSVVSTPEHRTDYSDEINK